jgi:hypothetical protein
MGRVVTAVVWLFRHFWKTLLVVATMLGVFAIPLEIQSRSEIIRPYRRAWAMVDRTTALWVAVAFLGLLLVWSDVRPWLSDLRKRRAAKPRTVTHQERECLERIQEFKNDQLGGAAFALNNALGSVTAAIFQTWPNDPIGNALAYFAGLECARNERTPIGTDGVDFTTDCTLQKAHPILIGGIHDYSQKVNKFLDVLNRCWAARPLQDSGQFYELVETWWRKHEQTLEALNYLKEAPRMYQLRNIDFDRVYFHNPNWRVAPITDVLNARSAV